MGMERDIINHVRNCFRCVAGKTPELKDRAPLESIHTSEPMQLVCIDFWTAEQTDKKCVDVLVVTDHFSKLSHTFPCKNQLAKQVARRLWNDFFCIYCFPKRIHSIKEPISRANSLKSSWRWLASRNRIPPRTILWGMELLSNITECSGT